MRGLLIKDLRLVMRQQRATLFVFISIIFLVIMAVENPMFGLVYVVFLLPALLISTISYDTFENGMLFLMSLPISRKDYVAEKYLLAVGGSVLINFVSTGFTYISGMIRGMEINFFELLVCSLTAQIIVLIYSAFMLPVNMCLGTEKGRIVMIIMAVLIGAILGGSESLLETQNETVTGFFTSVYQFGIVELLLAALFICFAVILISYRLTVKWMEKKEY